MSIKYSLVFTDDNQFDMNVDGEYHSTKPFVFQHLTQIAQWNSVNVSLAFCESNMLAMLRNHNINIEVDEW